MGNINYNQWINGNDCCKNNCGGDCDCHKDVCDCENILLELSKQHTDDLILQEEIDDLSGKVDTKLDASAYTPVDLTDYYTKEEVDELIPEVPSLSGYATEQWVIDKHYLTEHQPLKTINGNVISGTGNIVIEASGTSITVDDHLDSTSTNPVANSAITVAINAKLDASAYTPTDLSNYYTKQEVNNLIPEVPTSNSAFTNDMHYVTSAETANYVTSGNVETQIVNHFWCGTQAQYDAITTKDPTVLYLIHQ